jgi:hypothetical protein
LIAPGFEEVRARLGYAYVMNKMDFYMFMFDDPREKALRDAVDRAIGTLKRGGAGKSSR